MSKISDGRSNEDLSHKARSHTFVLCRAHHRVTLRRSSKTIDVRPFKAPVRFIRSTPEGCSSGLDNLPSSTFFGPIMG